MQSILKIKRKIHECDKKAREVKKQKKILQLQLKSLKINLVAEKKIKWVQMTFQHWMEETEYQTFYIWYCDGEYQYGVWEGEEKLSGDEYQHFKEFYRDYFYHGYPDFNEYDEMTEMEHGFEDGDLKISEVHRADL